MKNFPEWLKQNKWKVIVPVLAAALLAVAFWYGGAAPGLQGWNTRTEPPREPELSAPELPETPGDTESKEPPSEEPVKPEPEEEPDAQPEPPAAAAEESEAPAVETETPAQAAQTPAEPEQTPAVPAQKPSEPAQTPAVPAQEPAEPAQPAPETPPPAEEQPAMEINPETGKDQYQTDPVPAGMPLPVEPQEAEITDAVLTCTMSISCATILNHMDWLDTEKAELVPEDGWILEPVQVTFYEGESVFNVLQRVCKQNRIHMEFADTPLYNSAYIEGIHNLYEFDCGELSGWMYSVNDWFPNYGCSRYALEDGDVIRWVYSCEQGADVGGRNELGG